MRSVLGLIAIVMCAHCHAAEYATDAQSSDLPIWTDAKQYLTAPLHWDKGDWLYVGGSALAIAAAHRYDDAVRLHFAQGQPSGTRDTHSTQDFLPTAAVIAATLGLAWWWDDQSGYQEVRNMIEAASFSVASTLVLKQVVRRERVSDSADSNGWFQGGSSFPSTHVSAAMAVGAVLAESGGDDYRWVRRGLGYGLGVFTSYERLKHQQHWLSDTVASAALAMATARFVLHRNAVNSNSAWVVAPSEAGMTLTYAAAF